MYSIFTFGSLIKYQVLELSKREMAGPYAGGVWVPFCSAIASSLDFVSLHQSEIVVCKVSECKLDFILGLFPDLQA